jgi:hypothetical protein
MHTMVSKMQTPHQMMSYGRATGWIQNDLMVRQSRMCVRSWNLGWKDKLCGIGGINTVFV